MAVWKAKLAGYRVKINDVDHDPPHCHVRIGPHNAQVDLFRLEVLNPPPDELPTGLRKALRAVQVEMLQAWEQVVVHPRGRAPEW